MPQERRDSDWINPPDDDERDDYEPDVDADNDDMWLRKKEEEEEEEELDSRYWEEVKEHDCCRGDEK